MTISWDKHDEDCKCSYCGNNYDKGLHWGLNIPECKKWNSWWVIKYAPRRYFRWTNSWLKRFQVREGK